MNLVLIHLMMVTLINMMIIFMIMTIMKKPIFDMQKSTPFECGFNPMTFKRLPFSIHFFLIAVIFLIFDIEIIIIMPMILTMKSSNLIAWLLTSSLFILILIIGLYHEWLNGMLNWTK
uniref:NADH dehydrogenase subunit 3 n=1 Tax=Ziczacella heptapotamica TaxID=2951541 RepID=UPI00208E7B35|nr:NADH dehydrogenase subunit 3 [Ziczacella heptapotamica]USC52153.1 NADH dehydrogenase subunit 3 [Ziczacella heptapotamica]